MGKIYTSYGTVSRSYNKVREELWELGVLWDGSKLDNIGCTYLSVAPIDALSGTMGLYQPDTREIEFPSVYLPIRALWSDLEEKANALDVFRHEFGHALADLYPGVLKKGALFCKAFGGAYGDKPAKGIDSDDWEGRCVSSYATTATQEDFAETFMLYMKHKGKIPAKFAKKPAIRKKWKAVEEIIRRVRRCSR